MLNLDPNRKLKNTGFLPRNLGVQDSWQEVLGKISQEVKRWAFLYDSFNSKFEPNLKPFKLRKNFPSQKHIDYIDDSLMSSS